MGFLVTTGALLQCSFGMIPTPMNVLPANCVNAGTPAAVMDDNRPLVNIVPFGMCKSLSNPMVAAATAAAFGALTPMPCIPVCTGPWSGASQDITIKGKPALTSQSRLTCAYGGQIQISFAGQLTVMAD